MADYILFPALRRVVPWLAICGVPFSRSALELSCAGLRSLSLNGRCNLLIVDHCSLQYFVFAARLTKTTFKSLQEIHSLYSCISRVAQFVCCTMVRRSGSMEGDGRVQW